MANTAPLVSIEETKNFLDITSTKYDGRLSNIIVYATGLVESYCGRKFNLDDYTEYHDGGLPFVFVNNPPINNAYSVAEYDSTQYVPLTGGGLPTEGLPNLVSNANTAVGYTVDYSTGKIWKGLDVTISSAITNTQGFAPYAKGIKIYYSGGYTSIPSDLKLCTLSIVKDIYKGLDDKVIEFNQERLEKMPYSSGFPPHIRRVLDLYRLII